MDLGRYTCYYNGTTNLTNTGNSTSVYVFVNDEYNLFQPDKKTGQWLDVTVKHGERWSVVPCLPTHSRARVQLWKGLAEYDMKLVALAPHDVEFDPMRGFIIYKPHRYYSGRFRCNGTVPGRVYNTSFMDVEMDFLYPDVVPNVTIEMEESFHPVLKDTFTLNCTFTVQKGLRFKASWDYPNKNSSRIKETEAIPQGKYFVQGNVTLAVWTSQLTVSDTDSSDEGWYTCSCKDHDRQTYNHSVFVSVYAGMSPAALTTPHIALVTVVCVIFTCLLVGSFLYWKRYHADMKRDDMKLWSETLFDKGQAEMFNPDLPLCEQVELLPYDNRWEFPENRLKLGRTLGQGAFGRVVKAEAIGLGGRGQSLTVAVKMLKERCDVSQRKALMAELKILIHLGRHLNIVNILGAVTKDVAKGKLMVIVEYCKFGNLRHYLLRHRVRFVNQLNPETGKVDPDMCYSPKSPLSPGGRPRFAISNLVYSQQRQQRRATLKYADLAMSATPSCQGNEFTFPGSDTGSTTDGGFPESGNHAALMSGSSLRDHGEFRDEALTTSDLLCFAFQCARGMEYLASRKLIHRDLAARNVLLSAENVVKICDFGLAKDCYKYSNYVKKGDGLLPVKWTAIESIMDRVFTTKSDVWSYGVLLWEIFSLGGNPYPGAVIDESFYKRLKNGYRMEKPDYASDDVYEVMQSCWQAEPKERPDFSTLVCRLGDLLQAGVRDYYITLNDPYVNANMLMKNTTDYLTMGGKPDPDFLDMKSDDENYTNTSRAGAQAASAPHYAEMATAPAASADGSAAVDDSKEMVHMMKCGNDVQATAPNSATSYVNVGGPTLQLRHPPGKRRDVPAPLLPPLGNPSGDARASDDVSDVCVTPPPAYNLVVSVDGGGVIAV
ncbi:vascular endothelial growth factor receptor 1-like [Haemaphysalis longicornis]